MKKLRNFYILFLICLLFVSGNYTKTLAKDVPISRSPIETFITIERAVIYSTQEAAKRKIYVTEKVPGGQVYAGYIDEYKRVVSNTGRTTVYYRGTITLL